MMEFTQDWFDNNIPVWSGLLRPYAGRPGVRALEIGVFEGRSTCWLMQNILTDATSRVVCVDTFAGSMEHQTAEFDMSSVKKRFENNVRPWAERVDIRIGESAEVLPALEPGFDFAYVDGSHTAKDVLTDAIFTWRLVKDGGVIIFDDYGWPRYRQEPWLRPKAAVDALLQCHFGWYEILHAGYQVAIRKLGQYQPPPRSEQLNKPSPGMFWA